MAELYNIIDDVLKDWAVEFAKNRMASLAKHKLDASGDTIKSFRSEVRKINNDVGQVLISFNGETRILDMRRREFPVSIPFLHWKNGSKKRALKNSNQNLDGSENCR